MKTLLEPTWQRNWTFTVKHSDYSVRTAVQYIYTDMRFLLSFLKNIELHQTALDSELPWHVAVER